MARAAPRSSRPLEPPREGRPPPGGKGRGAQSNQSGRYEREAKEPFDDGWPVDEALTPVPTSVTAETPRKIINFVDSPFVGFDRTINPYRGCEHGCVYCFARPTHAYYGLSPGLDFETKLFVKPNAAALLRRELSARSYRPKPIAIGTNTDPYQPIERRLKVMRGVLETLAEFRHPVSVLTKSAAITRDIDVLSRLARDGLVKAMLSVTTLDSALARAMEPRAAAPHRRLDAIARLAGAGVPVGVMTAPMIPGLNDEEMEGLLEAARAAGAAWAGYTIIRLPLEVAPLFKEWLEAAQPHRAARVMRHIREMNGGRDYDPQWSRAGEPRSVYARLLADRFARACARLGLSTSGPALDLSKFAPPHAENAQLSLFSESPRG